MAMLLARMAASAKVLRNFIEALQLNGAIAVPANLGGRSLWGGEES
jgi:hypothetical protein